MPSETSSFSIISTSATRDTLAISLATVLTAGSDLAENDMPLSDSPLYLIEPDFSAFCKIATTFFDSWSFR